MISNCASKNRKPKLERARRSRGSALIEVLIALIVLAVIVPASLGAFGTVFAAELSLSERAEKASCAEWWFNRLEFPLSLSGLNAAPQLDERGKMRFTWETSLLEYGSLSVTLFVTNGAPGDAPYKATRVY